MTEKWGDRLVNEDTGLIAESLIDLQVAIEKNTAELRRLRSDLANYRGLDPDTWPIHFGDSPWPQ